MSYLYISKDIGLGKESKIELDINLSISGKKDSRVQTRLLIKDEKNARNMNYDQDMLHIRIIEKIPKKTITSEKGEPLEICYVSYFIGDILQGDTLKSINKSVKDDNVARLVHCDLLFIAICLDACEHSCKTVFPWYIGGYGSIAVQLSMLDLMAARTDFEEKADTSKESVEATAGATAVVGGAAGVAAGATMAATSVVNGTVTAESLALTTKVVKDSINFGAGYLALGQPVTAVKQTVAIGAMSSEFFGISVGAVAVPITWAASGVGLAIMGYKGYKSFVNIKDLKVNLSVIQKYAELVQRGNIGKYCANNELRFNEIWSELRDKCEICGAEDIFDLESKIEALL